MSLAVSSDPPPSRSVAELLSRDLEAELLGLAGHLAAAQCRFLMLLAEYDRRAAWAGPGLRSCAHWLSWRVGMSLRTAAEHVRVAHALTTLPAITAAFAQGRVSYSKVRAITRIATAESEQILLGLALAGTASHVERVVRATRRHGGDPDTAAAQRSVSWSWAEDGSLILRARLPAADGAALVTALEAHADQPARPVAHADPPPPPDWQTLGAEQAPGLVVDRVAARRADALVALVQLATDPAAPIGADTGATLTRGNAHVVVHVDAATGTARIADGPELPAAAAERLTCDAHVQTLLSDRTTNRMYLGRRRRLATPAQIAALTVRDGGRCQFAGCTHTRHLSAHHVRHWLRGGPTDLDNLVLLCSFHHNLIHNRGYRIHHAHGCWHTHRPDGQPVPDTAPPLNGRTERLLESQARDRLHITAETLTPTWSGEPLDPTPILTTLLSTAA